MQEGNLNEETHTPLRYWRGLGIWNLYFLAKLALLWTGSLNFHAYPNLVFAAALLIPLPPLWLHRLRNIIAIPIGAALFYHDTWLPPISRAIEGLVEISTFSYDYLLELATRLFDLSLIGAAILLLVAYLFLAQWLRITVFTVSALLYITLPGLPRLIDTQTVAHATAQISDQDKAIPEQAKTGDSTPTALPTSVDLDAHLQAFYQQEQQRHTTFTPPPASATPFDVLIINICSMAWSDLQSVKLLDHPLFSKMDLIFDNFNSATSYSAPASIRLMRASCGQTSNAALYEPPEPDCFLFANLQDLGFSPEMALNHDGIYGGYLDSVRKQGQLPAPTIDLTSLPRALNAFDGSPIERDLDVLNAWLKQRVDSATERSALFYNTITLHDGNRFTTADGGSKRAEYQPRAQTLLDDLDTFLAELERSGRKMVVLIVPEHGASLSSDHVQMAGMREIPSRDITHVPVGIRLIGTKAPHPNPSLHVAGPSSYLALSEIVSRLIDGQAFSMPDFDWQALAHDLPETESVAESKDTIVMLYKNLPYIHLANSEWQEYPH
ncbi:cellulose biosynthesis protein BcsG [Alcaligenaceae bacterium CGII-47]|nr:cellulose biosynthesis protein BcsG [Alcaligenaceae bacterium CGII-47]